LDTLVVTVGNTVDFIVEVEGLSDTPSEAILEIYKSKVYPDGLSDKMVEFTPVSVSNGSVLFVFDSDVIATAPTMVYGRFYVLDNGKKINAYFKLKFSY